MLNQSTKTSRLTRLLLITVIGAISGVVSIMTSDQPAGASAGHFNTNPYSTGCANSAFLVGSTAVSGGTAYVKGSSACGTNWIEYRGIQQTTTKSGKDSATNRWTNVEVDNVTVAVSMQSYAPGTTTYTAYVKIGGTTTTATCSDGCSWRSSSTPAPSTGFRLPFKKGTRFKITQGPAEHAAGAYPDYNRHAIDFAMNTGTPVLAAAAGKVHFEGYDSTRAIQVRLDHGADRCSQYVHLSRTIINKGQSVSRGQVIGYSGQTGMATGPHLHFNIVYCSTGRSREVVNTLEMGTRYPIGMSAYSQNG